MMRWRTLAIVGCALLLGGCFTDPDITEIVDAVAWELEPAELETAVELRLGDGSLGLLRWLCSWSDDCEEYEALFAGVDEVHLGVYDVRHRRDAGILRMDSFLREDLEASGWRFVVSARERDDDAVFVLARYDERGVYGMLMIVQDDEQLAVIRLDGELDEALHEAARRDEGFLVALHEHR